MSDEHIAGFFGGVGTTIVIIVLMAISSCVATSGKNVRLVPFPEKGELCVIESQLVAGTAAGTKEDVITECYLDPKVMKESTDQ